MLSEKTRRNSHGFVNHSNYRRRLIGRLGINGLPSRPAQSEAVDHAQARRAGLAADTTVGLPGRTALLLQAN